MRKKRAPRAQDRRPVQERGKRPPPSPEEKRRQSDDIERAVYDGMQDLRGEREKNR
jgi:hypothetical protein